MTLTAFESATRKKLRFATPMGSATTEDLWDLKLEHLDSIYRNLQKQLQDEDAGGLMETDRTTTKQRVAKLQMEIVKRVFEIKMADKERAEKAAATRAKNQRILELIESKEDEALAGKSIDELKALLAQD